MALELFDRGSARGGSLGSMLSGFGGLDSALAPFGAHGLRGPTSLRAQFERGVPRRPGARAPPVGARRRRATARATAAAAAAGRS